MKNKMITALATIAALFSGCLHAQTQVVLSSRQFHPVSKQDTLSTLKVVDDFKVDRIDWMYCDNPAQLNLLKQKGVKYSLAINPQVPDSAGYTTANTRIKDVNGEPLRAPWMKGWKTKNPYWGCVNNPAFKTAFISATKKIVDLGAYGVVVDDARFNDHAFDWGGCYCDYCVSGFDKYLQTHGVSVSADFNYRNAVLNKVYPAGLDPRKLNLLYKDYQTQSVVNFLKGWRSEIETYANRPFTFLTNNSGGKWNSIYNVFDEGIAEMPQNKTSYAAVNQIIENAKQNDKKQIFSFASDDDSRNTAFYLYCYLKGAEAIIPWDAFMNGNSGAQQGPARHYISHASILPAVKFLDENKLALPSAQTIDPSSLGITPTPGNITICKKLSNGQTYLFSSPDFQGAPKKANVLFRGKLVGSAQQTVNSLMSSGATDNLKKAKSSVSGDYILMKL